MATDIAPTRIAASPTDDLGMDRDFLLMLARVPFIAAGMMLAAWLGQQLSPLVPVVLLCVGMILAAVIDGIDFKVPNWLTLSHDPGRLGTRCAEFVRRNRWARPDRGSVSRRLPSERRFRSKSARLAGGLRFALSGLLDRRHGARRCENANRLRRLGRRASMALTRVFGLSCTPCVPGISSAAFWDWP